MASSLNDCWGPGIKRGLNPAGVHELAPMTYSRLSAPLSPAQSSLPNISFKTANATVGTQHFDIQDKKKKTKKGVKVDDLKPAKDPKGGGMPQGFPQDIKSLLKHLQLGQGPGR